MTGGQVTGIYIGTSGWSYDGWKDGFYEGVPRKRWLEHCADQFTALEVNGSFYRLQKEDSFRDWLARTPEGFVFAAKGHRYVTHNLKLKEPEESVVTSRDNMRPFEKKLAVVVWQLPASFGRDTERLDSFGRVLRRRWRKVRHAIEFRHPSWFEDQVASIMAEHDLAVCQSDAADWPLWDAVTTDLVYVRLHGHTRTYASAYSDTHLDEWAGKVRGWHSEGRDVHVYFDNDAEGAAPFDAARLLEKVR
jgi:uncharacterized protein YecE (DUF72 family)